MRRVETFFIVIAIAFYAWFLTHYGPRQVLGYVRMAGWGLALTISLETLARIANTLGWRVTIEDYPACSVSSNCLARGSAARRSIT